jgi:hypothetical protein
MGVTAPSFEVWLCEAFELFGTFSMNFFKSFASFATIGSSSSNEFLRDTTRLWARLPGVNVPAMRCSTDPTMFTLPFALLRREKRPPEEDILDIDGRGEERNLLAEPSSKGSTRALIFRDDAALLRRDAKVS